MVSCSDGPIRLACNGECSLAAALKSNNNYYPLLYNLLIIFRYIWKNTGSIIMHIDLYFVKIKAIFIVVFKFHDLYCLKWLKLMFFENLHNIYIIMQTKNSFLCFYEWKILKWIYINCVLFFFQFNLINVENLVWNNIIFLNMTLIVSYITK